VVVAWELQVNTLLGLLETINALSEAKITNILGSFSILNLHQQG
jgi:hypothetical protein